MNGERTRWFLLEINPEQWDVGRAGVARRNGKLVPYISRNDRLHSYQQAVKEILQEQNITPVTGKYALQFYFWRRLDLQTNMETGRKSRRHSSDTTNLQKALEDALQGVLIGNDSDVIDIHSVVVEQGQDVRGMIVVGLDVVSDNISDAALELPNEVYEMLDTVSVPDTPGSLGHAEETDSTETERQKMKDFF